VGKAKDINFANFRYISPSEMKGKGGVRHLHGKLRYFQYRNDKADHIAHQRGKPRPERWRDMGLGGNYHEILKNCQELQSENVLAWTWVVSPAPDLMALVPEGQRRDLVRNLTENIVTGYYEARGLDVPDYSYVLHDRNTAEGEQQLHTHVVLPGTVETLLGREAFFNNKKEGHVELFNRIADAQFAHALDSTIGPDWRALRPELQEVKSPTLSELDVWFGPREAGQYEKQQKALDKWFGPREADPSESNLGELDAWFGPR
jgi:hypothetical protein